MFILIDNYDSFTYNLYHYLGELGAEIEVHRNDKITVDEVLAKHPQGIILSPGPCDPDRAGICLDLVKAAAKENIPLLGVCLGQQLLFEGSDEAPDVRGLGLLPGRCRRLPPTEKVPHVGWNSLEIRKPSRLLEGVHDGTQAYFTHSYAADITDAAVATTTHSAPFASVVETPQLFGVQFHPEKSGESGIRILKNFVTLCSRSA